MNARAHIFFVVERYTPFIVSGFNDVAAPTLIMRARVNKIFLGIEWVNKYALILIKSCYINVIFHG